MADLILSIIIPVYNCEKYIRQCLSSVSSCPIESMECIMVDDGSQDGSREICVEFQKKDPRFLLLTQPNSGVSIARNLALHVAQGSRIMFLDADDYLNSGKWDMIQKAVESSADFTAFSYTTLFENRQEEELFPIIIDGDKALSTMHRLLLTTSSLNTCWGKIFKKDILSQNNIVFLQGMKTGEDAIFILEYARYVKSSEIYNDSVLFYRQHENSAMRQNTFSYKLKELQTLYDARTEFAKSLGDSALTTGMKVLFFSIITNLFLEYSFGHSYSDSKKGFTRALAEPLVKKIIKDTPKKELGTSYKKLEYWLIRNNWISVLTLYFKLKNKMR